MGHTLAELAPHVKLENYLEDTSSVYYSPPPQNFSTVFGSLAPAKGAGAADLGQTHTDARVRAWRLGSPYACIASRVHMPAALSPPMHTPRMCCFCEVDAEAAAHWQDPDTVARVLKGWCDARCAGSFCTRASGPRCPIASPALCHKPSALPHSRDAPLITDTHPVTHR